MLQSLALPKLACFLIQGKEKTDEDINQRKALDLRRRDSCQAVLSEGVEV